MSRKKPLRSTSLGPKVKCVLFQELMDNVPDVIYFKDKKGKLIYVNKAHARGLGLEPGQVAGKSDFDFFPRDRAMMMAKDDRMVMEKGKPIIDKVERATRPDGVDNYVSTTKVPRFDEKGRIIGLIGITRDITHRQQLEALRRQGEKMKKQLESLREIDRLKTDFISVVSHELRTPLAIAKEAVTLALDGVKGELNPSQKNILQKAKDSTERLNKIIEELLEISRIEKGKIRLCYSLINIKDLIKELIEHFNRIALEKRIVLSYKFFNRHLNIFVDAERLTQILINLIDNALKFTEEGGSVQVEVKIFEDKVRFGVIDTGVGISKQDQQKIFDRFLQVSNTAAGKNRGIGLGLSIVKELVKIINGDIWVDSIPGVGSKFYFTIPKLYTANVLNKDNRSKINDLIQKGFALYLLNVKIIRYKEFQSILGRRNQRLLNRIIKLIEQVLKELCNTEDCRLFISDFKEGECGVIFVASHQSQASRLAGSLKARLGRFLQKSGMNNIFFNIGLIDFPTESFKGLAQNVPANIRMQKINIGANKRRNARFIYRGQIEILHPQFGSNDGKGIDISIGGLCFTSDKRMPTDSKLVVRLKIPTRKKNLELVGRVAWISEAEPKNHVKKQYKVGIEFSGLSKADKKDLARFLKSIRA